jgi:hypothetical protein
VKFEELQSKLKELDVIIPAGTIRRWAAEDLIKKPMRRPKSKGEGRGTVSDWSQQSLEEIAGVWAVKRYGFSGRYLSETVPIVKRWASMFYKNPFRWKWLHRKLYNDFYTEGGLIESYYSKILPNKDLRGFGKTVFKAHSYDFDQWVMAIEKVRAGWSVSKHVNVTFIFRAYGTIEDKTFQYRFEGTELTETTQKETGIAVFVSTADQDRSKTASVKEEWV